MGGHTRQRAVERIAELSCRGLDLASFWRGCSEVLADEVPHFLSPCWYTLDPASLLITSHVQAELPQLPPEWLAQEYLGEDVNQLADVARSERGISTLHDATGGDPASSPRWHENMRYGGDQELIAALRTTAGQAWGALGLYREPGQPMFGPDELDFVRTVTPLLAEGARRGLLVGEATDPEGPDGPGLVVLASDWSVESTTPLGQRWLQELLDADVDAGPLPPSVYAVAAQALRVGSSTDLAVDAAMARVRTRSGRWLVLHGAALASEGGCRAAVIIEPAHPARIVPLLMSAYRLTEREQEVTRLVLQGRSTTEIAASLVISPHTVQEHLKHIFDKTGVRTRRDLVGTVFFAHYEPRVRDNEERAKRDQPIRGQPREAS
jgi:DNA-binding CsgD family transcriptional regulator